VFFRFYKGASGADAELNTHGADHIKFEERLEIMKQGYKL